MKAPNSKINPNSMNNQDSETFRLTQNILGVRKDFLFAGFCLISQERKEIASRFF